MPKKKKGTGKPDASSDGWTGVKRRARRAGGEAAGDGRPIAPANAESTEEARTQELRYLQEMFDGKLDPVVVHMIMNDCEFKVEAALETLFQLAEQTSPVESQMYRLSGFKDVYIPSADAEEQDDNDDDDEDDDGGDEEDDDDDDRADYMDEKTLFPENLESRESLQLRSRGIDGSDEIPPRDLGPLRNVLGIQRDEDVTENIFSQRKADSLSDFPLRRGVGMPRQGFRQSFPKKENPFAARDTQKRQDSSLNNLSKVETQSMSSVSEGSGRSRVVEVGPSPESSCQLNIYGPSLDNREKFLSERPERKNVLISDRVESARGSRTKEYTYLSSDLETDAPTMPQSQTQTLHEQLRGRGSVPPLNKRSKQTSPGAEIVSGTSPVDLPSDELDALLGEIEMCPENLSALEPTIEPVVTGHHVELASEASNDQANLGEWSEIPNGGKHEANFPQVTDLRSADDVIGNMKPSHESTPIKKENQEDKSQKRNLNTDAPSFVPRAYAGHPTPMGHLQYPPPQGLQPRPAQRMPLRPAGRASSLRKHLNQFDGQVGKPFFAPFPSSQEQRPNLPRGVERQGWNAPHQIPPFGHPAQEYQPPESRFRPISKSPLPAPFMPQMQASRPLLEMPRAPNQSYQPFGPRRIVPLRHGIPRGGTPPSALRSNSPHEDARQTLGPPQWPVYKQTSYAPRQTGQNAKKIGLEDRALPLPEGKVLCLMRGCPGSGKSTLARKLVGSGRILSSDDFFTDEDGQYHFDVTKLNDAHDWSHQRAKEAMELGITPIIIDNTNIERWTMKPYVAMALHYGYALEFREPTTPWKFKLGKLFKYNTHGVPRERIKLMIERFEKDVTVENILSSSKPNYKKQKKKTDEAEEGPSSQGSWRRSKKKDENVAKVEVVSGKDPAASRDEAPSEKEESNDALPEKQEEKSEDEITMVTETVQDGTGNGDALFRDAAYSQKEVRNDDDATSGKEEGGSDEITMATVAVQEDIGSGEEMFVSDNEDWFDAPMDPVVSDMAEEVIEKLEEDKVKEKPQEEASEDRGKEDAEMMASLDRAASCDAQDEAGHQKTDQVSNSRTTDGDKVNDDLQTRVRPEEQSDMIDDDDEDDFLAMMNAVAEASCGPPLAAMPSLEDGENPQGSEQGVQQRSNPTGWESASDVKPEKQGTFTYPPGFELLSRIPEQSSSRKQKGDTANIQSSCDDDDFAEIMSLITDSSCREDGQPAAPGRDEVVTVTSAQDSEIKTAAHSSPKAVPESSPQESSSEAQVDTNLEEDRKTEDAGSSHQSLASSVQDAELSKEQAQLPEQQEKDGPGSDKEDPKNTSLMTKDGVRTSDEDEALVQDDSFAEKTTRILSSDGDQASAIHPDIRTSSGMENASEADDVRECTGTESQVNNAINTLEGGLGEPGEKDGDEVRTKVNTGDLDAEKTTEDQTHSRIAENENHSLELLASEETPEAVHVTISSADKNGSRSDSVNQVEAIDSKPRFPGDFPEVNAESAPSSSLPTSPSCPNEPATTRCRSISPSLLVPPTSNDESRHGQERRKLRRSKSHSKHTKMAAVFPTLSPGSENWSELAEFSQEPEEKSNVPGNKSPLLEGVTFAEAGTVTLPSDFSCVQRLESGEMTVEDLQQQGLRVAVCQPRQIMAPSESSYATEREVILETPSSLSSTSHSPIPVTLRLHKSTMTDPEKQMGDIEANLRNLVALFPSVSQTDLQDILSRCTGDLEWATNILLDDFGSKEQIGLDLNTLHQLKDENQQVIPGFAKAESDCLELQVSEEKLANVESMKDILEAKQVSQADNLATNMISVVDDILKTISPKYTLAGADYIPLETQDTSEREDTGNGSSEHPPVLQGENLSPEMKTNLTSLNFDSGTSDKEVKSDFIASGHVPTKPHLHWEREDSNFSGLEQEANQEGLPISAGSLNRVDPSGMLVAAEFDSQILLGETGNESPILDSSSSLGKSRSTGGHHQGFVDQDSSAFRSEILESIPSLDPPSSRREIKEEQVVRPKTSSRTTSRQSSTKASKVKKPKDPDVHKKSQRIAEAEAIPRRQELEVPGGVKFSWNDHGEVEEFRVPRAEQMMARHDDASKIEDGSMMTEERADEILQDQPVQKKLRELRSSEEGLVLQLPPAFALQLQEMFGPVPFNLLPDDLPAEDLQVHVDYKLAKQLHTLWAQTLQTRFDKEEELESVIKADEELARKLQQEEDIHHMTTVQASKAAKYQSPKASPKAPSQPTALQHGYGDGRGTMGGFVSMGPPHQPAEDVKSLREIMEEMAAQVGKDAEVEEKLSSEGSVSIATKLKRDKLYKEFPTLDRDALEEIFRNNNFQLDPTVRQIKSFFMLASGRPQNVYSNEALERIEKELIEAAERESLASSEGTDESNPQDASYQSTDDPDYQDYRTEATQHYRLRHEAFQKAAAAYSKGQRELASFYSQQGHLHTEKMKEANKRASEAILVSKNSLFADNTLDLHGLHVDEALQILNQVLAEKKAELAAYDQQQRPPLTKSPQRHIFIITGKGNRSRGGVARIRPAVTDLLRREGYRFSMPNSGLIKVGL